MMSFRKGQSPFFECMFLQIYLQESLTLKNQRKNERYTIRNEEKRYANHIQ